MPVKLRKVSTLYQGYTTLMSATLTADDGSSFTREIEHHGHAAAVLPYDAQRRCVLLVSLPRAPAIWADGPPELAEAIAGLLEGDAPEDCARREAMEEAGVRLRSLEPVGAPFSSPGLSSERVHLFLGPYAERDHVGPGGGLPEEHEHISVMEVLLVQLWDWVEARKIEDLKTLALILALRVRRPDLFATSR